MNLKNMLVKLYKKYIIVMFLTIFIVCSLLGGIFLSLNNKKQTNNINYSIYKNIDTYFSDNDVFNKVKKTIPFPSLKIEIDQEKMLYYLNIAITYAFDKIYEKFPDKNFNTYEKEILYNDITNVKYCFHIKWWNKNNSYYDDFSISLTK